MTNAQGIAGVAAALAMDAERRAADYYAAAAGPGTWEQDYGPQRRRPNLDAARLHDGWGWDSDGDRSAEREGGLDDGRRWSFQTLWRALKAEICPGTMVFIVCVAITTFIVVV